MILFSTNPQNAGPKELERGKPLGTVRPAYVRAPTQSRSSDHDSVNAAPGAVEPGAPVGLPNTLASASLSPLNGDNLAHTSAHSGAT